MIRCQDSPSEKVHPISSNYRCLHLHGLPMCCLQHRLPISSCATQELMEAKEQNNTTVLGYLGISYKHSQTTYSQKPHINNIKQQRGETLLEARDTFCWHASLAMFWPATLLTLAAKSAVPSHTDVSNLAMVVRSRKIPRCAFLIFCSCFTHLGHATFGTTKKQLTWPQ